MTASSPERTSAEGYVPESNIVAGHHPAPGERASRTPWNGPSSEPPLDGVKKSRIYGIDAARGFALFGMIAVHTLGTTGLYSDYPSSANILFSGKSATLFALLAGVSLAIITGMSKIHSGRRLARDRWMIAFRGVLLLFIGSVLNYLDFDAFNILPYYGVFFLAAVPFLGLNAKPLFGWAISVGLLGPVVHASALSFLGTDSTATLTTAGLVMEPTSSIVDLLLIGIYPTCTWLAYVLLGMAIGRLDLRNLTVQVKLTVYGLSIGGFLYITSNLLIDFAGVFDRLLDATPGKSSKEIIHLLSNGGALPPTTWWWQVSVAPHSNTVFSVFFQGSLAVAALGAFLIAERFFRGTLQIFSAPGSMTLTLYVAHLVFLAFVPVSKLQITFLMTQLSVAIIFAMLWQAAVGQGPLEKLQAKMTKTAARTIIPVRESEEESSNTSKK
ncbi:DUF418 domain-containing protein [Corynebacterium cystitidis]|uniref:Uncharacterized membrane protein YeiB n=1 Tax=Corynebacterium cystitidis DSM 20524 TaxID=1121357 RepID=A0A1H9VA19_9CORY|nr:heparan-alpha-glucosaminide N-acetyltransferase domain-containing protein [Corynebacterium cystitidis]WJY82328.1 hypothetical protein CCYS_07000 [Corynebacterium cystitidis DSM 20524]SES18670.1 Uncharacterized membrane protein YeiB [Corynebacterium cystitidis DSM 20524]SNV76450.1 Predicted membrane protein [Corynebacterium cystitidis]